MRNVLTYHNEQYQKLNECFQQVKDLIGTDNVDKAIQLLYRQGLSKADEAKLLLLRNRRAKNEKAINNNDIIQDHYNQEHSKIIKQFLTFCDDLEAKQVLQNFGYYNFFLEESVQLEDYLGQDNLLRKLEWLENAVHCSQSICQVQTQTQTGSACLVEDGYLFTTFSLIPDRETASNALIKFSNPFDGPNVFEYRLDAKSWQGNESLGITRVQLIDQTHAPLAERGFVKALQGQYRPDRRIVQIQHSNSQIQELHLLQRAFSQYHNNTLSLKPNKLQSTNGAPIFNHNWELIGLTQIDPGTGAGDEVSLLPSMSEWLANPASTPLEQPKPETSDERIVTLFSPHHKYTCDRNMQYAAFKKYYIDKPENQKAHFFYIHGGDEQAHSGLFHRFSNQMAGLNYDHLHGKRDKRRLVKKYQIKFPESPSEELLRIEVPEKLFAAFGIVDNEIERVKDKCLKYVLENPSSDLYGLTEEARVCILFTITEVYWYPNITPKVAEWFIRNFCLKDLPDNGPEFYFFFAVEYDEDNEAIREEIEAALKGAQYTQELPELDMVPLGFVKAWFKEYAQFWNNDRRLMKQTREKHFKDYDKELYMEDVQYVLGEIIDDINKFEKDANRHS